MQRFLVEFVKQLERDLEHLPEQQNTNICYSNNIIAKSQTISLLEKRASDQLSILKLEFSSSPLRSALRFSNGNLMSF